jgi:hypothetical protein
VERAVAYARVPGVGLDEDGSTSDRCGAGARWCRILRWVAVAVGLAMIGVGTTAAGGWASPTLVTGRAHPFVFVTSTEVDAARKAARVRRYPLQLEAFTLQQARADRWLPFPVPRELPFGRQYGDAARDLALVYVLKRDERYAVQVAAILRVLASKMGTEHRSVLLMSVHSLPLVLAPTSRPPI